MHTRFGCDAERGVEMTYDNIVQLTQNVHHGEAVVESETDEEATQTELPKACAESRCNTCGKLRILIADD